MLFSKAQKAKSALSTIAAVFPAVAQGIRDGSPAKPAVDITADDGAGKKTAAAKRKEPSTGFTADAAGGSAGGGAAASAGANKQPRAAAPSAGTVAWGDFQVAEKPKVVAAGFRGNGIVAEIAKRWKAFKERAKGK